MKKLSIYNLIVLLAFFSLVAIALKGCGGGGGGGDSSSDGGGGSTSEASATIGSSGGTIEVTNPSSSIYGVKVEVPAGAVQTTTTLSINVQESQLPLPSGAKKASEIISLGPDGVSFNLPVSISIPYSDIGINETLIRIYKYDKSTSSWDMSTFKSIDTNANIVVAYTTHFSSYAVLSMEEKNSSDIDFEPSVDGFSSPNYWGDCYGMVGFAKWFWENKKSQNGGLMNWKSGAHLCIATKAQNLTINENINNTLTLMYSKNIADKETVNSLMIGLIGGQPQMIIARLIDPFGRTNFHALLAYNFYKISDNYIDFYIYDPNAPKQKKTLTFDGTRFYDYYVSGFNISNELMFVNGQDIYHSTNMETVFRVYSFNALSYSFSSCSSGGDSITVDGVRGTSATIIPGAEYEICGTYTLGSRDSAQILGANYAPYGFYSSTPSAQNISRGNGHYSVGFKVLNVDLGFEKRIGIGFYPIGGGNEFFGSPSYGCDDIYLW